MSIGTTEVKMPAAGAKSGVALRSFALSRDPWVWAGFAVAALYALEMATQWGGAAFVRQFVVVGDLPTGVGAFLASAWAAHCLTKGALRRAWWILACAQLSFVLGSAHWAFMQEALGTQSFQPFPSPSDGFYIGFYLLAFLAMVEFSATLRLRTTRLAFALDGSIFVAAVAGLMWATVIVPFIHHPGSDPQKGMMSIVYACGSGMLVFGIGTLLLRGRIRNPWHPLVLLGLGFAVLFTADLSWLRAELSGGFKHGGWPDALYVLAPAILIAAARQQALRPQTSSSAIAERIPDRTRHSTGLVPLLVMLATGSLVMWLRRDQINRDEGVVLVLMIGATALAGVRQLISAHEITRIASRGMQRETEHRFAAIFQQSADVIVIVDHLGRIQYSTPSLGNVLGYSAVEVDRVTAVSFVHPEEQQAARNFFRDVLRGPDMPGLGEWRLRSADGEYRYLEITATNLLENPSVRGVVITMRDITERRALQDRLSELAFKDSLTLLSNRSRFRDALMRSMESSKTEALPVAILFVDLDNFKRVNDSLGHQTGDELLRIVAERIQGIAPAPAEIARLGGDEFAVLLHGCAPEAAQKLAIDLIEALCAPLSVGGATLTIGASIGIATAAPDDSADDVLRHADIAMYDAKRHGKCRSASFEPRMQLRATQRLDLEERLRQAIAMGGIALHFQPVLDMRTQALCSVEVLARWEDASHGNIPAGEFIALAEDSGQIVALGRHVLSAACAQVGRWRAEIPELAAFTFAVNVSARQFDEDDFVEQVEQALRDGGLPADSLLLELTESAMLNPRPQLRMVLERLRQIGVRLALDDFGAGYSSLSYLHRFPFDVLKIDRALVERVGYSADGTALVRAVLSVAEALSLSVIAEGVEEREQQDELLRLGCWLGQGFLLAHPMPAEEFRSWLEHAGQATAGVGRTTIHADA